MKILITLSAKEISGLTQKQKQLLQTPEYMKALFRDAFSEFQGSSRNKEVQRRDGSGMRVPPAGMSWSDLQGKLAEVMDRIVLAEMLVEGITTGPIKVEKEVECQKPEAVAKVT